MDYKEKIARIITGVPCKMLDGSDDPFHEMDVMNNYELTAEILNTRQDCGKCYGEGKHYGLTGDAMGHRGWFSCDKCQGTGKAGLSLGEVWERYQQGKLVELDDGQELTEEILGASKFAQDVRFGWEKCIEAHKRDNFRKVKLVEKENK